MDWLQRVCRNRLFDFGMLLVGVAGVVQLVWLVAWAPWMGDYEHYYVTGRLFLEGRNPYTPLAPGSVWYGLTMPSDLSVVVAPNPPPFLWLITPFVMLPVRVGYWLWAGLQGVSLATVLAVTCWLLRDQLSWRSRYLLVIFAVGSSPVYWHFHFAQVGLLLAALVMAGYACLRSGRPMWACALVTVAGLLKLYPFVLLPWFVWRGGDYWRGQLKCAGLVGLLIVVGVFGTGWSQWVAFRDESLAVIVEQSLGRFFNFSLPAWLANLRLAHDHYAVALPVARVWGRAAALVGLALVGGAYLVCWRGNGRRDLELGLLIVAMLAGGLRTLGHYFVFLIFPIAVMVVQLQGKPTLRRVGWFVVMIGALNYLGPVSLPWVDDHLVVSVVVNYFPLYGLLALGVGLGVRLWRKS